MSSTYYINNKILDYNLGSTSYSVPGTIYMGLSTTSIDIAGTGATEPSTGSYARVAITNDTSAWNNSSSGVKTNKLAVTFPESTAAWGTITHVFFADASTSGNVLYYEALTTSKVVQINTTVYFAIGAITVNMINT
jgi:hypothetical protein